MPDVAPDLPPPPSAYTDFNAAYPDLAAAWDATQLAGETGPMSERDRRLVKLAIAVGTMRASAVHSAARKARAAGVTRAEMAQVVRLAAGTLGFPAAVAVDGMLREGGSIGPVEETSPPGPLSQKERG